MAGDNQWTAKTFSQSNEVTTSKTWLGGFIIQTNGTSTPGLMVAYDSNGGTARLSYAKTKSGTGDGGKIGTVGDSEMHNIKRPLLFGKGLYVSLGAGGLRSCVATVFYKLA